MSKQHLVTRGSLIKLLQNEALREQVIGRALVGLLKRQTQEEADANTVRNLNLRGFAPAEAKQGCIHAKTFIKTGHLLQFQIDYWMEPTKQGYPRLVRYVRQLNEIANEKQRG